jgi:hypothetical protein
MAATAVSLAVTLVVAGSASHEVYRFHAAVAGQDDARPRALDAQVNVVNEAHERISSEAVQSICHADRTSVTCTFTNVTDATVMACARGVLRQKEASGVKLESAVLCTGDLMPMETKTVVADWIGGVAEDICSIETSFGSTLDWNQCVLSTKPVELPTIRQAPRSSRSWRSHVPV